MNAQASTKISKQTSITLGLVVVLLASVVLAAFRFGAWTQKVDTFQQSMTSDMKALRNEIRGRRGYEWDIRDAQAFHHTMSQMNPGIKFPEIGEGQ